MTFLLPRLSRRKKRWALRHHKPAVKHDWIDSWPGVLLGFALGLLAVYTWTHF